MSPSARSGDSYPVAGILRRMWAVIIPLAGAFTASAAELVRGPYLQSGTPTSVIVKWRTDVPTASIVFYGDQPDDLALVTGQIHPTTEHQVRISGLSPASKYFYSVGSFGETLAGGDSDHFFITHPPAGSRKPVRIWAIGDCGT